MRKTLEVEQKMGKTTKIPWCDATWSPVTGCMHGCRYCYARDMAKRFSGDVRENLRSAEEYLNGMYILREPFYDASGKHIAYPYGFAPTFHRYRLDEPAKLNGRTIFVGSMCDMFGEWVPDEWIRAVFDACEAAPQHSYLFLTKNPARLCRMADEGTLPEGGNYWWGSTLDTMEARRYPGRLLDNTFLSIEPLLEYMDVGLGSFGSANWIIIGAETGNRSGKVVPEKYWVDKICEAAAITNIPVFMKDSLIPIVGEENMRREFPEGLRIERSSARMRGECMVCGKKELKKRMVTINGKKGREGQSLTLGQMCPTCIANWCGELRFNIPEEWKHAEKG